jgi:hypothetical protein
MHEVTESYAVVRPPLPAGLTMNSKPALTSTTSRRKLAWSFGAPLVVLTADRGITVTHDVPRKRWVWCSPGRKCTMATPSQPPDCNVSAPALALLHLHRCSADTTIACVAAGCMTHVPPAAHCPRRWSADVVV